nr:uncharacterized protein LOC113734778 [Coffea arabica]
MYSSFALPLYFSYQPQRIGLHLSGGQFLFTLGLHLSKTIIPSLSTAIERRTVAISFVLPNPPQFLCSAQATAAGKAMDCCWDFLLMLMLLLHFALLHKDWSAFFICDCCNELSFFVILCYIFGACIDSVGPTGNRKQ